MAVYTKLDKAGILSHLQHYDLGELIDYKGIKAGIDNSNYILETTENRFILTIFESRIEPGEIPFFTDLKLHLAEKGICCPRPILTNDSKVLVDLKGKKSIIVNFLDGNILQPDSSGLYSNITDRHCFEVGNILSKLHIAVGDFKGFRKNDLGVSEFRDFFGKFSKLADEYQENLSTEISQTIDLIESKWNSDLQSGAIHSDLFPDNVFFEDGPKLSGVIDFYFAANDLFIYDLAVMVNAWCFDENNQFVESKYINLIKGYEQNRIIPEEELEFFNIALIAASTRFLLTRLNDYFFTPKDSLVTIKDPKEYIEKLRYFVGQAI